MITLLSYQMNEYCLYGLYISTLYLLHEYLSRFETWYVVGGYGDRFIFRNDPPYLFFPILHYKTAKTSDVNILTTRKGIFHHGKETFQRRRYICLIYPCLL